jgi:hypothetical protein
MSTAEAFEFETECWCAGLPLLDRQPLTPSEREALERRTAHLRWLGQAMLAAIAVLVLWPFAVWLLVPNRILQPVIDVFGFAMVLGWLLGVPMLVLAFVRFRRLRRLHEGDLARDEVLVFGGELPAEQRLDEELRELFRLGLLRPEARAPQTLRVLGASHTVFMVASRGRLIFHRVGVAEVAPAPRYGMRVVLPQATAWLNSEPSVEFLKRTLSHEELAELDAHVRRLRHPRRALLAFAVYGALIAAAVGMEGPAEALRRHGLLLALQLLLVGAVAALYARSLLLASRLRRDMATGWALTFHRREPIEQDAASSVVSDPREGLEFLPHSLTAWIEHGRPARWRNLRARP